MRNNDNTNLNQEIGRIALDAVGELTPITIKEARKVLGEYIEYTSDEAVATAILDFTAIARAYFRTVPKY
jgi:hypothetical protein